MPRPTTPNILRVYDAANGAERHYGAVWYPTAHNAIREMGREYGLPADIGAAVVSALSPGNSWLRNLADADSYMHAWAANEPRPTSSTYPAGQLKAWAILQGEFYPDPLAAFSRRARKTRAFYLCLAYPHENVGTVVVDGHAWNIAAGTSGPIQEVRMGARMYDAAERAYIRAAEAAGITPQAMQATTWLTRRRMQGQDVAAELAQFENLSGE